MRNVLLVTLMLLGIVGCVDIECYQGCDIAADHCYEDCEANTLECLSAYNGRCDLGFQDCKVVYRFCLSECYRANTSCEDSCK